MYAATTRDREALAFEIECECGSPHLSAQNALAEDCLKCMKMEWTSVEFALKLDVSVSCLVGMETEEKWS